MSKALQFLKFWFFQILLFFLLISPSLALTYFSYYQLHSQLTGLIYSDRQALAKIMASVVEARLNNTRDIAKIAATDMSLLVEEKKWTEATKNLEALSKEFPFADRVFLTDKSGVLKGIYPPSPENLEKDFSFRDWYKGVSQNWQPYASEVFKRAPTPQFNTVAVAVPIKDTESKPIGVLGLAMSLDSFYELTKDVNLPGTGFLYIVNQKGQIVAHPKFPSLGEIVDFSSTPAFQKILAKKSGVEILYNPVEKEERLTAVEIVPEYNWGVVIADPIKTAFLERDNTLKEVLKIYGILILINSVLALILLKNLNNLRRANEKLQGLEKLKDEFVSLASHELRTPMGAVRSLISTILAGDYGKVPEELKDPLNDIKLSTERLINLVNDMLNVSRIEAGRLKFEFSEFDIYPIVEEVGKSLEPLFKQQGLSLDYTKTTHDKVLADSDKVKQLLNNLVGNSLKFTQDGGIKIYSKTDGEFLKVFVEDSGLGMKKEDQKKLFGKFQQITTVQEGKPQGTGLGLYLSRQIAQKMGGDLNLISSEEGKGSLFMFSLPIAKTKVAEVVREKLEKESNNDQKPLS